MAAIVTIISASLYAAEFNVSTAQELQSALTTAASNGEDDIIILEPGYYIGNFIFSTSEAKALTLSAADGVGSHEISLDGNALGRTLDIRAGTVAANLTISGITLVRNCNNADLAALEVATAGNLLITNCQALATGTMKGIGASCKTPDCQVETTGDRPVWRIGEQPTVGMFYTPVQASQF